MPSASDLLRQMCPQCVSIAKKTIPGGYTIYWPKGRVRLDNQRIVDLRKQGLKIREIAETVGRSSRRVHQILAAEKRKGKGTFTDKQRLSWLLRKTRDMYPSDRYIRHQSEIDSAMRKEKAGRK